MSDQQLTGTVLEIQRMSTEDGPGIRTTVFLKGCTLKCSWCHNPESISPKPQLQWVGSRCIGCKTCIDLCKQNALKLTANGMEIDRKKCIGCGECAEECPGTALELLGKKWKVEELADELAKDKAYFENSSGGITISGGEVTMQAKFAKELLINLREKGLHTAIDTCGQCKSESLDLLLPHADMVLFDIKEIDNDKHKEFTGSHNDTILENIKHISSYINKHKRPESLWIRTPIIPGTTANEENIAGIGKFIAENLDGAVDRWELCAFNNLCKDKYTRLDMNWQFSDDELFTKEDMESLTKVAKASGVDPDIVNWSGSTRLEEETEEKPKLKLVKGCQSC